MKQRCYGDFVCDRCCTITHKSFEIESMDELDKLGVECPGCGKFVQLTTPPNMKVIIRNMVLKGYHISMIFGDALGVAFYPKVPDVKAEDIPFEFTYDTTEEKFDIIANARLQADDFDNIDQIIIDEEPCKDKEDYISKSILNLLSWVRKLPQVGVGREINLDNEKKENFDEE